MFSRLVSKRQIINDIYYLYIKQCMADYYGDNNKKQVHDLNNQKDGCKIDEIRIVHRRYFIPDTHSQANSEGYASCIHCIEDS